MSALAAIRGDMDELLAALLRLDLRLRLAVDEQRPQLAERARDPFRGLYISESDVDELLAADSAEQVTRDLLSGPVGRISTRLNRLASLFDLDEFEQEALLICLAPELDLRYERLYAYLQDDVSRRRPSVELILRLLGESLAVRLSGRDTLGPAGRLMREGLVTYAEESAAQTPLLARALRVDERVAEFALGGDQLDARIAAVAHLFRPDGTHDNQSLTAETRRGLERLMRASRGGALRSSVVYLHGPAAASKIAAVRQVCIAEARTLLVVDTAALLASARVETLLGLIAREALLQDAVLCVDGFDRLLSEEQPEVTIARSATRRMLERRVGHTILVGETRWEPGGWLPGVATLRVELPTPGAAARGQLWRAQLDGALTSGEIGDLASRYRLDREAIRAVAASALSHAVARGAERTDLDDYRAAARAIAAPPLEGLARRIEPRYGWDDIVLPVDGMSQLLELCARARHQDTVLERWGFGKKLARRASLTALFGGQPGTGKTMASEIIAGELGLVLYRIDLSAVVSKYIGETEKNLEKIFQAADRGDAVLLFDEADALFGKRSEVRDAHDRYANVEIAYLLQRLEAYEGVAVLTTNLRGNIDEAFLRRLDCVLEFPMPEEPERLLIWRRSLPSDAPLAEDVDLAFLARKFRLAGGHIRNIALTAAFLAAADGLPIGMRHLVRGTRREYQKLGKLVAESDFEGYYQLLKDG